MRCIIKEQKLIYFLFIQKIMGLDNLYRAGNYTILYSTYFPSLILNSRSCKLFYFLYLYQQVLTNPTQNRAPLKYSFIRLLPVFRYPKPDLGATNIIIIIKKSKSKPACACFECYGVKCKYAILQNVFRFRFLIVSLFRLINERYMCKMNVV